MVNITRYDHDTTAGVRGHFQDLACNIAQSIYNEIGKRISYFIGENSHHKLESSTTSK